MGCVLDAGVKPQHLDPSQCSRRGRIQTIDTRKKSTRVVDVITENVTVEDKPISNLQISFAVNCLQKNSLFSSLRAEEVKRIAGGLVVATAEPQQYIFKEGQLGNCFFLIEKGEVIVEIANQKVKTLTVGQTFGEIALILRAKRTASIKAKTSCQLLVMKPLLFRSTMEQMKMEEYKEKRQTIEKVEIFAGLTNKQKLSLSNALKFMVFEKGERIFTQNDLAIAFYIISEGKVVIEIENKEVMKLSQYDTFGESALLDKGRRRGSAIATEKTVVALIARDSFEKHLGTSASNVYFYNIKKWALKRSPAFCKYSDYSLNAINLGFQIQIAKNGQQLKSDGLVICLEGLIKDQPQDLKIFGEKQWKNSTFEKTVLRKEKEGAYAYLSYKKLNKILDSLEIQKYSRRDSIRSSQLNKENNHIDLSSFEYIKDLGEGQFGAVKLIKDPSLNRYYALKQISKQAIRKENLQVYIEEERRILEKIEFTFIVGFVKAFSDEKYVYFLMEYIRGVEMFNVIREMPSLNKQIARYFFASILLSIEHLHSHNIIYRDIKPENSVVDHRGKVFLIDLGTAKLLKKERSYRTYTVIGTPHYMAPQVFQGQGYSFESDIWSLGVLMYEFLCNKLPFGEFEEDPYKIMDMIKREKIYFPKNLQPQAVELLKLLLNRSAKDRSATASFEKIKESKYFEGFNWINMLKEKVYPPYIPKEFKKQGGSKAYSLEGKPLIKELYPKEYGQNNKVTIRQWDETTKF